MHSGDFSKLHCEPLAPHWPELAVLARSPDPEREELEPVVLAEADPQLFPAVPGERGEALARFLRRDRGLSRRVRVIR